MEPVSVLSERVKEFARDMWPEAKQWLKHHPRVRRVLEILLIGLLVAFFYDLRGQNYGPLVGLGRLVRHGELSCIERQAEGRFDVERFDWRTSGWKLQDEEFLSFAPKSTRRWDTAEDGRGKPDGKSLKLVRGESEPAGANRGIWFKPVGGKERFTEFPRIEFQLPKSWQGEMVRLNATLQWSKAEKLPNAYPAVMAVSFKIERKDEAERYITLLGEAVDDFAWKHHSFEPVRLPVADKITARIGLHGVTGELLIDEVSFDLCE